MTFLLKLLVVLGVVATKEVTVEQLVVVEMEVPMELPEPAVLVVLA